MTAITRSCQRSLALMQRWRPTDDVQAWKVEELELAAAWYADGDDVVVIEMV